MKKVVSLLAVLFLFAGLSFAATASSHTYTARVSFSGAAYFDFALKNINGDGTATEIGWDASGAALNTSSTTVWVKANQYAVVTATVTKAGFNVYMYQTNTTTDGNNYVATSSRTNADGTWVYSGLVNTRTHGGNYQGFVPVAYSIVPTKRPDIDFNGTAEISSNRSDRYFKDVADSDYKVKTKKDDQGKDVQLWVEESVMAGYPDGFNMYTKIAGNWGLYGAANMGGVVYAVGADGAWGNENNRNTAYMYFFGGFANIIGGDTYGTNQLHIVEITE